MGRVTTETDRNRAVVQGFYAAGRRGDLPSVMACLARDVLVHEPAFLPYGGDYLGHDGFADLIRNVGRFLDVTDIKVDYLVAEGDKVIGILRVPDRKTGRDTLIAEQSTLRDGQIVDMRLFFYDAQSLIDASPAAPKD